MVGAFKPSIVGRALLVFRVPLVVLQLVLGRGWGVASSWHVVWAHASDVAG